MPQRTSAPAPLRSGGEIDLATAPALRRALTDALREHHVVVLDLSQVTFMDCVGLGAQVAAAGDAHRQGRRLVLRAPAARVSRLLRLTGTDRTLAVEP
ncbi:hypothetical protein GCM10020229_72120 [Kitasatospora albolonga]|uniref:STAS domain-containing protein n=1 Tax=Kitasatospora albolonga TaxID=68173 RepID=UPI0031E9A143